MARLRTDNEGVAFVKDVISTFVDPELVARIIIEQGKLHLRGKGNLGRFPIASGQKFMSLSIGEYNIIHSGIANAILALTDQDEGIKSKKLVPQIGNQLIDLTMGYYFDFFEQKPKTYVYTLARNTLKKMTKYGLLELHEDDKYYRTSFSSSEFVSQFYGRAMTNPNGISSFYRVMVIGVIGVEGGIGADFVPLRLRETHKITNLKKEHLEKVLDIHGPQQGTGYILSDIGQRCWRMYERIDQRPSSTPSIIQTNPELMKVIVRTPCVPSTIVYELFGPTIAKELYLETGEITPNFAQHIVVRRGDMYLTGSHVEALKLRKCEPENNPALSMVRDLYSQFSPKDCMSVAFYARDVLHELFTKGEYKPQNEKERRILSFLQKRKLVETELFGDDVYFISNRPMIRQLSWVLGNILD